MKTLSKYIAATAVATSLIGLTGFAFAQTTTQTNSVPAAEQTTPDKHFGDRHARHEQMLDKMFTRFDPGKTGSISIDAFLKGADTRFEKLDTKKQGFIDHDELQAYFGTRNPQMVDRLMNRLDTDNDGKITKAEFEKPLRKRFALLDLNDDGKITREEADLAGPMQMGPREHGPHQHGQWQHRHDQKPIAQ